MKKTASSSFKASAKTKAAATLVSPLSLETPNAQLVLARRGDIWTVAHLGAKGARAADFAALAPGRVTGDNTLHEASQETYPAFGCDRGPAGFGQANKRGALQARHADGDVSVQWRCVAARELADTAGARHVALELADKLHPSFRAVQHFVAWADCDVFETWVELRHGEEGDVALARMDSLCLELPGLAEEFHLLSLSGQWGNEANISENEIARGQETVIGTRSGVRDAWDNNPSFMLSVGARAGEDCGRVLAGALCWSGAWEIRVQHAYTHELRLNAGAANLSGPYILEPGRTLTLPKFVFSWSENGKGAASRALHRWARLHLMPHGRALRDVLLNSWEGAYFTFNEKTLTDMMDGTKSLGGETFVIDDGWFGLGEFARDDDRRGLGDWFWNDAKLPKGLAWLVKEAKRRGLKLGLWFEPEMANMTSELLRDHPDWALQEKGREIRKGRGRDQVVLDMANPAVRDEIFRRIDAVIRSAKGLAYIKWDANADIANVGSAYLGPARQGNLWFDYTQGVYELFARLRAAHPGIVFQACSSGGAHAEFGFLGYADEFWGSDDTCAQQRIFIQWGEQHIYPAAATAAHVTVSPNHQTKREASLKFRFDVAMSGRLGFELHPAKMTAEEVAFAKKGVETYKRLRPVIQRGDLYRLASPYATDHSAMAFVSEDRRRAVVFAYGLGRRLHAGALAPLRLAGLDPAIRYRVTELNLVKEGEGLHTDLSGKTLGGDALAAAGIPFRLSPGEDSMVLELTAAGRQTVL